MNEGQILANLVLLGIAGVFGLVIGLLALRKHRNPWMWGMFGAMSFLMAGIVLAFMSVLCPKCKESLTNEQWKQRSCPHCGDLRVHAHARHRELAT